MHNFIEMTVVFLIPQLQDTIQSAKPVDTVVTDHIIKDTSLFTNGSVNPPVPKTTFIQKPAEVKPVEVQVPKEETSGDQWNTSENFLVQNSLSGVVKGLTDQQVRSARLSVSTERPAAILPHQRKQDTFDWLLGIFLFLVVLFVWIRVFYSKFFGTLANALASYHLSAKMFEEKNVFLHRVSIVLDFIYIVVFSVFIFEILEYKGYTAGSMRGMHLFLLLFNIIMIYTLLRVFVLRIIGSLFLVRPLFAEYIHNTFVINKGMGIALFPVIIMGQYFPYKLIPIVLGVGLLIFIAGFFMKNMRSYQIIIRRDILLFYLILYLCTLEILPLLLGYKFVTSLIQNN